MTHVTVCPLAAFFSFGAFFGKGRQRQRHPGAGRQEADAGKDGGDDREPAGEQAPEDEHGDGFGALGEAGCEIERLDAAPLGMKRMSFGHDRECEEGRPVGVEARQQHRAGDPVRRRIGEHEAQRHRAVEEEVEDDVEIASEIGLRRRPRHRPVEPVGEPAEENERQAEPELAEGDRGGRREPRAEPGPGDRVGRHSGPRQPAPGKIERRIDQPPRQPIQHSLSLPSECRARRPATAANIAGNPAHPS